jgi:hypothetical protein
MMDILAEVLAHDAEMRGPPGPAGPRGEQGAPGKLPMVKLAVPLLSDGGEGAPLELRDLFKQFFDEVAPRA